MTVPYFPILSVYRNHTPGIDPVDMAAADSRPDGFYLAAAHHLRGVNGGGYRTEGGFNVHHHPFPHPRGRAEPHAGYFENALFIALSQNCANLGRTYVEADN
jgi:hypothetical protein